MGPTACRLQSALRAVLSDAVIALLPDFLVGEPLADGTLREVLLDRRSPEVPIYLVHVSRRLVTSAQRAFTDFVVSESSGGDAGSGRSVGPSTRRP